MKYTWSGDGSDCVSASQPHVIYECVPPSWVAVDVQMIAGVTCIGNECSSLTHKVWQAEGDDSQQQVATADPDQSTLVNIITRDENSNVIEFVRKCSNSYLMKPCLIFIEIINYTPGHVDNSTLFELPPFCDDAPILVSPLKR